MLCQGLRSEMFHNRRLEEPLITLLGPAMFKMLRILAYVVVSVHLACCMYYRVKVETSPVSSLELWQHYILVNGIWSTQSILMFNMDCRKIQTLFLLTTSCCPRMLIPRSFHSEQEMRCIPSIFLNPFQTRTNQVIGFAILAWLHNLIWREIPTIRAIFKFMWEFTETEPFQIKQICDFCWPQTT